MEAVKEIKGKVQTAAKGVMSKKSAKKSAVVAKKSTDSDEDDVEEVEEFEDDEEEEEGGSSYAQTLQSFAAAALENTVNNKAVGMFLAFSLAIYFQGDQLSV
jgi:hypothetical protein